MPEIISAIDKFKLPLALSLVGIVLIIGGVFASGLNKQKARQPENFPKESLVSNQKQISVDISGAVAKPGVYQLDSDSRIEQAIEKAGGFSENANKEYVSKYLNLAQKLTDGSKIYIPAEGETTSVAQSAKSGTVAGINTSSLVNINTATQAELEALPGIGPVSASKIVNDRPYQKIEELVDKKVIGKSVFEKIKDSIAVY